MKVDEPTWPLERFRAVYEQDDLIWWTVGCGHHMNLFEQALHQIDELRAAGRGAGRDG